MFEYKNIKFHWLGHDSFLITAKGKNIYIDPYELTKTLNLPKADFIITSHEHYDHCNPESINILSTENTVLIGPKICQKLLNNKVKIKKEVKELNPYEELIVEDISFSAIPAYNFHRFRSPGVPFHPKKSNHIGPILQIDEIKIYHAGDTDNIEEMKDLNVDVALLPVSGTYVMDVDECVDAARSIKPKIVIPMHVGRGIGEMEFRYQLKEKLSDIHVEILDFKK
jgi:L-ascorbate metabolism protein UlaG (beta-lactamase superfamily)